MKRKIRRAFDRVGYPIEVFSASRTKQSFVEEADINNLMRRYRATGLMPQAPGEPMFLDCTKLPADYQAALNTVITADRAFQKLSSDVRARFGNDPVAFVDFAVDPANLAQMREWKLAPPAPAVAAVAAEPAGEAVKAGVSDGGA